MSGTGPLFFAFLGVGLLALLASLRSERARLHRFFRRNPAYLRTLRLKRAQLVYVDDYGDRNDEDWERELGWFIERKLPEGLRGVAPERLDRLVAEAGPPEPADPTALDPLAFEAAVAEAFEEAGWEARTTRRSGDQGADVVADRGGRRVVVQCKRRSQSVGNAAVQEAVAARHFYRADAAIVVATSGFTKAARQLADSAGVDLVAADDLEDWISGQEEDE